MSHIQIPDILGLDLAQIRNESNKIFTVFVYFRYANIIENILFYPYL